jgi:cytochrome c peroxidase
MISEPTSRLPKMVSATTLLLVGALLLTLLDIARTRRDPSRAQFPLFDAHPSGDSISGWRTREPSLARIVFEAQLDSLATALDILASTLDGNAPLATHRAFRHARLAYKRAESLLELYSPTTAHALNGPLEIDDPDAPPRPLGTPAGFQQILTSLERERGARAAEPRVSSRHASCHASCDTSRAIALSMRDQVRHLRTQTQYLDVAELPVLESARSEIARVTTLGLAGADLDDPSNAVREAAAALDGMRAIVEAEARAPANATKIPHTVPADAWLRIARPLERASGYLRAHPDFEHLDRLELITRYANPAARAIAAARAPLLAHADPLRRVWRAEAATVFEPHALDPAAFAPDYAPATSPALIALGARLFADTRLSGAQDRSCATCHQPTRAFTDGRARPLLISAPHATSRNTPTLLEVAYQPLYFADQRALSLEDQIGSVLASPAEMGSSAEEAAAHIARDPAMIAQFTRAFASRSDSVPSGRSVRIALAAYLRSLGTFDSRFDRAARGDPSALSPQERRGFTLFMSKARCGTCHFAPLFSGVRPPELTSSEPEIIGVPAGAVLKHATLDPDSGRARIDHVAEHLFAFKVPTLRNIARTAPYMHNGAYRTLDEVLDFYERGGGAGVGAHVPGQTLSPERLRLTHDERGALIAFLRALTDTVLPAVPPAQPLQPNAIAAR